MSSDNITVHHGEEINKSTGVSNKKLLMWAFLGSDVMFFGTFIGTFMAYRNKSLNGPYPADTLDIPITTVSIPSSGPAPGKRGSQPELQMFGSYLTS